MKRNAPSQDDLLHQAGETRGWGESNFTLHERTTIRPALTINGVTGGYQGPGGKAVIPSVASAKLSFRLVPDQNPKEILGLLQSHLHRTAPPTVRWSLEPGLMARHVVVDRNHPAVRAAAAACAAAFGTQTAFLRCGGTIPVVSMIQEVLKAPTVLMGFAPPGARIHAPNEHFHLPTFFKAVAASSRFLEEVGRMVPRSSERFACTETKWKDA
jgi:acetylornithine deacetylase/succinyl-diaminopimelate desuccinylase-like protein